MKPTGIVRNGVFLKHEMGAHHPESPRRLEVIYQALEELAPLLNLLEIEPRPATHEELCLNHAGRYVDQIAATAGGRQACLDPDTSTCADSWDAACMAAGGLLNLVGAVIEGTARNGFAFVRPPGHHAEHSRAMGFCLFNNVALAARYAMKSYGLQRVAIVDWDLHHGNGTQNAFYEESKVLFISTHQSPHYPGTGRVTDVGRGPGEGYTINIPLSAGAGDTEYVEIFHAVVAPALEAFKPELILVSAGFDAHGNDPLGGMGITEEGYEQMVRILMHLAAELCSNRLALTLEGGYDLFALRESVARVVSSLASYDPEKETVGPPPSIESLDPRSRRTVEEVIALQKTYWPNIIPVT